MDDGDSSSVLEHIAKLLGKGDEATRLLREAQAREEAGDLEGAIKSYKRAYRLWPALDSVDDEGLPSSVRREADAAGIEVESLIGVQMDLAGSPRFALHDVESWKAYLDEHGYCVLKDVASRAEVAKGKALVWDFMEGVPGTNVSRKDIQTWEKCAGWLPSPSNGILGSHGFAHSEFCWRTRLLPGVKEVFSTLWETDDLLVSFDGGNLFRPWQVEHRGEWKTKGSWWHTDQNPFLPGRNKRCCVQGFLSYTDATPATGGLCVIPGSHKMHQDYCERAFARNIEGDFVMVLPGDPALRAGSKLVCAQAGDLVVWDSRTIHCNTPGQEDAGPTHNNGNGGVEDDCATTASHDSHDAEGPELLRLAAYVCMTPAAWAAGDVLEKRREAYMKGTCTDHWPHFFSEGAPAPDWFPVRSWRDAEMEQKRLIVGDATAALS